MFRRVITLRLKCFYALSSQKQRRVFGLNTALIYKYIIAKSVVENGRRDGKRKCRSLSDGFKLPGAERENDISALRCSTTYAVTERLVFFFVPGVVPKRPGQVQADVHQTGRGLGAAGAAVHQAGQELFGEFHGLDRHRSGYVPPTAATSLHADEPQELLELVVADGMRVVSSGRSCTKY